MGCYDDVNLCVCVFYFFLTCSASRNIKKKETVKYVRKSGGVIEHYVY